MQPLAQLHRVSGCAVTERWRDPWPSVQPDWHDPPWIMSGRAATAWFDLPWELVLRMLSPDLLPAEARSLHSRLRFYDLSFHPLRPRENRELEVRSGRFREGAIGLPVRAGGFEGETSLFLWTDSEDYLLWGREAFGWPLRLAEFEFSGDLWNGEPRVGVAGSSRLSDAWGSAALLDVEITERVQTGTPSGCWFTPRRLLHHDRALRESRELLAVRPVVQRPGTTYAGSGRVEFDFREPHPLAALRGLDAHVDLADDFELLVGADVSVIPVPEEVDRTR